MATTSGVCLLLGVVILACCRLGAATIEDVDMGIVQTNGFSLNTHLEAQMTATTAYSTLLQAYQEHEKNITFTAVNGEEMVLDIAGKLKDLLQKKMEALQKSVAHAEQLAADYVWNDTLKLDPDRYVNTKAIESNDTNYVEDDKFKKRVNMSHSSVHIPVEIYEGDIDILNALTWTDGLDEVWKQNIEQDPSLLWQYFGSQTGIMRNYPASKWRGEKVDLYDVRRRPWYTQGASSPKNMLILVDTSGSTHGQALLLMKQAVVSLIDTLGENDFVNVAWFSEEAEWVVPCFENFVQANYWNKAILKDQVQLLKAKSMASYTKALEFAFKQFRDFQAIENEGANGTMGQGADCNRIIMFLTDGGTEMPKDIFQLNNWPEKRIRIFSYAVGPSANPIAAVRWIACSNRGYFYKIPAMGAIRSTVQEHVEIVARPLPLSDASYTQWSNIYRDALSRYYWGLSKSLAGTDNQDFKITSIYSDTMGLGMMTTVTLPVYNRTMTGSNQTILGVMGIDITIKELEQFIPLRQLGPNGYAVAINSNGYIVFHPNLKAVHGWLSDPPNVDFLDVEYSNEEKKLLRQRMIDGLSGYQEIDGYVTVPDERHIDQKSRTYYYAPVASSNFSLAIVLPPYASYYISKTTEFQLSIDMAGDMVDEETETETEPTTTVLDETVTMATVTFNPNSSVGDNVTSSGDNVTSSGDNVTSSEGYNWTSTIAMFAPPTTAGIDLINRKEETAILWAPWDYCKGLIFNSSAGWEEFLLKAYSSEANECDKPLLQQFFMDAKVTAEMIAPWKANLVGDMVALFASTSSGLTRVYPESASDLFDDIKDPWKATYYKRAFDNDGWMYSAPYRTEAYRGNSSDINIMVSKAITLTDKNYKPGVIGMVVTPVQLRQWMLASDGMAAQCQDVLEKPKHSCYLLDDGGFLIGSNDEEDDVLVGMFFGHKEVQPYLMRDMVDDGVYIQHIEYDYQAACPVVDSSDNAGPRTVMLPFLMEMLTLKWWTAKIAWAYVNFNIYNWLFYEPDHYAMAAEQTPANRSCINVLKQYTLTGIERKGTTGCRNCTRTYADVLLTSSNLLLVMVDKEVYPCHEISRDMCKEEEEQPLTQQPVGEHLGKKESTENFLDLICNSNNITERRYRTRPACYDYNTDEDNLTCSGGAECQVSMVMQLLCILAALFMHSSSRLRSSSSS